MTKTRRHEVRIPHFAVPFSFSGIGGHARVNEQGRYENTIDQIRVVLAYIIGYRIDLPEFGRPDLLFRQIDHDIASTLSAAVARWIPDIDVETEEIQNLVDEYVRRFRMSVGSTDQE
jgi:hypothetical protein